MSLLIVIPFVTGCRAWTQKTDIVGGKIFLERNQLETIFIPEILKENNWPTNLFNQKLSNSTAILPKEMIIQYYSDGSLRGITLKYKPGISIAEAERDVSRFLGQEPSRRFSGNLIAWRASNGKVTWMLAESLDEDGLELATQKTF